MMLSTMNIFDVLLVLMAVLLGNALWWVAMQKIEDRANSPYCLCRKKSKSFHTTQHLRGAEIYYTCDKCGKKISDDDWDKVIIKRK